MKNKVPITQKDCLPEISGIYRVWSPCGKIIYLGQSKNIRQRWKNHHKYLSIVQRYGYKVYLDYLPMSEEWLNRAEAALYAFHKPELNDKAPPLY